MIHSLLGQSEALTISGTILFLNQQATLGSVMICLGVLGAVGRHGSNIGIVQKHLDNDDKEGSE